MTNLPVPQWMRPGQDSPEAAKFKAMLQAWGVVRDALDRGELLAVLRDAVERDDAVLLAALGKFGPDYFAERGSASEAQTVLAALDTVATIQAKARGELLRAIDRLGNK